MPTPKTVLCVEATARPWKSEPGMLRDTGAFFICPIFSGGAQVASGRGPTAEIAIENAALIVKSVNESDLLNEIVVLARGVKSVVVPNCKCLACTRINRLKDAYVKLDAIRKGDK